MVDSAGKVHLVESFKLSVKYQPLRLTSLTPALYNSIQSELLENSGSSVPKELDATNSLMVTWHAM